MNHLNLNLLEKTPRVERLRKNIVNSKPELCSQRAVIITESYRRTEGEPIIMRRAKALKDLLERMSIFIGDDELIVGHQAEKYRSAPFFPEMDVAWLVAEFDTLETRAVDPFIVSAETRKALEDVFPYWQDRTLRSEVFHQIPAETRTIRENARVFSITAHEETGLGHVLLDYELVLKRGFAGIKQDIENRVGAISFTQQGDLERRDFLTAAQIVCDAVIHFANRYATLAAEKGRTEKNARRKKELEQIAVICSKVPENPASNFYEALQSLWFVQLIPQIETNSNSYSLGRFDQYGVEYLEKDIQDQTLDRQQAQELLDCFWIKFNEPILIYKKESAQVTSGFPMGQNIVVGGMDSFGNDATNSLSYMCLNAQAHVRFGQPNFSIRVHKNALTEFLRAACEVIKLGNGMPQAFNDEIIIPSLMERGYNVYQARDYGVVGCVENAVLGQWGRENGGYLNLAKVLELTLNNGVCLLTGNKTGLDLGNLTTFETYAQLWKAYKKQLAHFIRHLVIENIVVDKIHAAKVPVPYVSILVPECLARGKDVTEGGAKYNFTCPTAVGIANTADSLSALKKLIFDEGRIDKAQLLAGLQADFKDAEILRRNLINNAPKYGNDIDYVDKIAQDIFNAYTQELTRYVDYRGGSFQPGFTAVTANIALGHDVGATPDGRKATQPLAEGVSPVIGRERNGPTAIMKSVSKLDLVKAANGHILNLKLNAQMFADQRGVTALMELLRTFCELDIMHIQFNTISVEILREAQKKPEEYRDLVVRVAGYSAFYTCLSEEVQNTIIQRTEHMLVEKE
jgi:formate C-acetyltransferase